MDVLRYGQAQISEYCCVLLNACLADLATEHYCIPVEACCNVYYLRQKYLWVANQVALEYPTQAPLFIYYYRFFSFCWVFFFCCCFSYFYVTDAGSQATPLRDVEWQFRTAKAKQGC